MMSHITPITVLSALLLSINVAAATSWWQTDFVMRTVENGKKGKSFLFVRADCQGSDCILVLTSLNDCIGGKFYPKVQIFSSKHKLDFAPLKITNILNGSRIAELEVYPGEIIHLQMMGKCKSNSEPFCNWKVQQLSGSLTKTDLLGNIVTINYELVSPGTESGKLDCPVDI